MTPTVEPLPRSTSPGTASDAPIGAAVDWCAAALPVQQGALAITVAGVRTDQFNAWQTLGARWSAGSLVPEPFPGLASIRKRVCGTALDGREQGCRRRSGESQHG